MNTGKRRARAKGTGRRVEAGSGNNRSEPDIAEMRRRVVAAITPSVVKIAKSVAAQGERGNYLGAKFLFEFLGIYPPPPVEKEPVDEEPDSLARYLLRKLGIPEPPPGYDGTQLPDIDGDEANTGTVESS